MEGFGPRALVLLVVTAAMAAATPAAGQMYRRTAADGTSYFTNIPTSPSYQRTAFTPATARGSLLLPLSEDGAYSREIAEAAVRYAVPKRLIWSVIRAELGFVLRSVLRKLPRVLLQLIPETAASL